MLGCKRVVLLALVALVLSAVPGASAADEKDCEGACMLRDLTVEIVEGCVDRH
jgi:hypothetical protein